MSWSSRFNPFGGRLSPLSPFGRSGAAPEVNDNHFSYITNEDIARSAPEKRNEGENDKLVLKHRKVHYPTFFPSEAIDRGELTIGDIRNAAARKLDGVDPRKVKLFYKGRNLKEDSKLARDAGFRSGNESEILCVIGEIGESASQNGDSEDESGDDEQVSTGIEQPTKKKRNRRGGKKAKDAKAEYLPMHSSHTIPAPRPTMSAPSTVTNTPLTPMAKLQAIEAKLEAFRDQANEFWATSRGMEKLKREQMQKGIGETIMREVLLKLDGVEIESEDPEEKERARAKRKELVREVQGLLARLDERID
ncbi:hypothetical protein M501DRAFT_936833 [Patellaria atrata CBS 101060]|uniref:BAG domain-containing protein n=1 Tax=Patellaria atrata CBS 101060 TaxID=1346257 RepID=A0A9P4S9Q7_9PEZI|nr:hypothetical protein M501DRAFT_936833 [Patellaria atrata CBS 101060]